MDSRIITSIGLISIALLGSSCQRQELEQPQSGKAVIVFSAHAENDATKASIAENETSATFIWTAEDAVGISDGTAIYKAAVKAEDAGKASAGFTVTESVPNPAAVTFAGYPYSVMTATAVTYPAVYENYTSGAIVSPMLAIVPEGNVADGTYDYGDVAFKHIGGMVKVAAKVPAEADAMVFTANGDVKINGTAAVKAGLTEKDIIENTWKAGEWTEGTSSVEFRFAAAAAETEMIFFVPLPEGTAFTAEGFSISLKKAGAEMAAATFPFETGYTVGRAKILRGLEIGAESNEPVSVEVKMNTETLKEYAPTKVVMYNDADGIKAATAVTAVPESVNRFQAKANQSVKFTVLPSDYNMEDFWVVVELKRTGSDNHLLYIPTKHSNVEFKSGGNVVVDLSGLSAEMNDAPWFAAGEARLLPATGVAYGEANTYFIQCKNGSTYTGATYTENANIPDEVTIDYRARGNFLNAEIPEGVTFDWFKLSNGTLYTARTAGWESSGVVIKDKFTIVHNEAAKTVTVKNTGAYAGAPILVMKKGEKILWAWSFWNVAADGTSIEPVTVGDYKFAPMEIGQPTTDGAKWIANKNGTKPDPIYRFTHLYQFGRYAPIFWTSYWSLDGIFGSAGNLPAIASQVTFEESLANPVGFIVNQTVSKEDAKWCSDDHRDLWGPNMTTKEGNKTIYDPCPKGWRIPSVPALNAIVAQGKSFDITANGYRYMKSGDLVFPIAGYVQAKIASSNRPTNYSNGEAGNGTLGTVWGNVIGNQAQRLYWQHFEDETKQVFKVSTMNASNATPVRCIVDTENR